MISVRAGLIVALTSLLAVAYAEQSTPVDATGTVEVVSVDDFENQREETQYRFHDETTGQRFNLTFNGKAPAGMRTGDRIRVRGQHLGNTLTVAALDGQPEFEMVQPAVSLALTSGEQHMIVILISFTNAPCTYSPTTVSNWLFRTSGGNSVDGAYRESSLGAMWFTGTVVGPYVINADVNVYDDAKWRTLANAAATAAGVNLNLYNRRVYTTDDFKAAGWGGLGTVGGEPSWAMIKNANATTVYVHELGHNVGMGHAGTDSNNDGVIENAYGDNSCPMGSPYAWREFNAAYKAQMGWVAPAKIRANPTSGTYILAGIENDFATLTDKRLMTISVPGSSWPYYLSFKIPVGYDASLGTTYSDKLFIHRFQNVVGGACRLIDTLVDNETFSDTNVAFKVTQLSHTASNATIRLTYFSDDIATWKTNAASAVWSAASAWTPAIVPDHGAAVIFGTGGSTSVVDTVSRTVGTILFNRANNFTINATGGAVLAINDGITVSNSFIDTINAPVILGNTNTWLVTGTGTLQVGGAISGDFPLIKTGPGALILKGNNTYSGSTLIADGTLTANGANALSPATTVTLGNTAGAGNLTLTNFNQIIAGLAARSTSATETNIITLAAGRTLAVTDDVTIGANSSASAVTKLTATGSGALAVTNSGGIVQIGGATGNTYASATTLDLSGLTSFTANLGSTGTFRVGDNASTSTAGSASTVILATNSTLTAGTVGIGDITGAGMQTLKLGSGVTTLNVAAFNIGLTNAGGRSSGQVLFSTTNGSLIVRGAAGGSSRAALNIVNHTSGTGSGISGSLNVAGHSSDLMLGGLTIASRQATSSSSDTGSLTFDTGTLNVSTVLLGQRETATSGTSSGTLAIGGGTATLGSIILADSLTAGGIAHGTLTLTGGTVTVNGTISKGSSAGAGVATVTLDGAALDMTGHSIGSASQPVGALNFKSGTLKNLAAINGTAGLTKTTAGTLTLAGANTYTGVTAVSSGTLLVSGSLSTSAVTVASAATLAGTGTIGGAVTVNAGGVFAPGPLAGIGTLTLSNALTLTSGSMLQYALGASNDLAVVRGALTLDGTLNITDAGGFGVGTYTLFTYTGPLTNNGVIMGTVPSAGLGYLIDTNTAGQVKLLVIPPDSSVWSNPAATGNWSNPLSWNPSVLPAIGADVIFGTGGITGVVDTVSRTVGSILFNRAGNFTINATGGGVLAIHDGITVSNNLADTIDAPVILGNTNTWLVAGTGTLQSGGAISGDFPLIKTGTGSLTLSATNTFTGGMTLLAGMLNVSSDSNLGGTNSLNPVTLNGGTLTATKPFTLTFNHPLVIGGSGGSISAGSGNTITLASSNTLTGSGTLNLAGASSTVSVLAINAAQNMAGAININSGRILINGAAGTLGTGPVTVGTGSASIYLSAAGITLNNAAINIQSNGGENRGAIRFASGGTTTSNLVLLANAGLSQEGTSTANLNGNISGGFTLQLNGLTGSGTGTWNLGGSNSVAGLTVAGGTVNANASKALGTGGLALTVNGGTLNLNTRSVTVGRLAGTGGTITDTSAGAGTTVLTVSQSATTTVSSAIQNGSIKLLALTKAGSGTLTLTGTNGYTGATTVSAGTLLVSGSLGASAVNVASNATLSGTGKIGGALTINAGGIFSPGPLTGTGTLTLGNSLITASSARLQYGLGTSSDLAAVTGALNLGGTLDIADAGGFGIGTYTLFTYTGALTCTGLAIGTKPNASLVYTLDTNTVGQVKLVVQSTQFVAWQVQYFGSATLPQSQPDADPDGDHLSNADEYLAGTNPKLSSSVLAITDTQRLTNGTFSVTWQSVSGKTYRVAYAPSLNTPWLTNLPNSILTSTGQTTLIYVDQTINTDTNRFYRINLVP